MGMSLKCLPNIPHMSSDVVQMIFCPRVSLFLSLSVFLSLCFSNYLCFFRSVYPYRQISLCLNGSFCKCLLLCLCKFASLVFCSYLRPCIHCGTYICLDQTARW